MNYVPIVVATDLEVHFSVLKKGVSQYFCLYSVCTSHWCLVMSIHIRVCLCLSVTLDHKTSLKSLGYICSNSQKYIVWVKIIHFSFMPKIIRILSKDHVP